MTTTTRKRTRPSPPRADELDAPPVIGQLYLVPCVPHPRRAGVWFPVLFPRHIDADPPIDFDRPHFAYDPRFLDLDLVVPGLAEARAGDVLLHAHVGPGEPELRPLRCLREMPAFPNRAYWLPELERAYAGRRSDCRTCPHRGVSLRGLPEREGGLVECPGHGLRWRLRDGALAPRCSSPGGEDHALPQRL